MNHFFNSKMYRWLDDSAFQNELKAVEARAIDQAVASIVVPVAAAVLDLGAEHAGPTGGDVQRVNMGLVDLAASLGQRLADPLQHDVGVAPFPRTSVDAEDSHGLLLVEALGTRHGIGRAAT